MGDIVHWKDGREVYDSVNVIYRYRDGRKICYESLISNKFNGMEDQILGSRGTMEPGQGESITSRRTARRRASASLIGQMKDRVFAAIPAAGPSWRPGNACGVSAASDRRGGDPRERRSEHGRRRQGRIGHHPLGLFATRASRARRLPMSSRRPTVRRCSACWATGPWRSSARSASPSSTEFPT